MQRIIENEERHEYCDFKKSGGISGTKSEGQSKLDSENVNIKKNFTGYTR